MREGDVVCAVARMVVSDSGTTDEEIDADYASRRAGGGGISGAARHRTAASGGGGNRPPPPSR